MYTTINVHVLMRDEKDGRKKQARSKQHSLYTCAYNILGILKNVRGSILILAGIEWTMQDTFPVIVLASYAFSPNVF